MPTNSAVNRLLPHLRRVALAGATETGDGQLLGTFVASRDEASFATIVRRHGPMVLGVCRRVIGDQHLAEDAFQATFLVLARRAAVVRPRHLVGHWLYGVAYRTALKARGLALRRKAKEKQVDAMPQPPVSPEEAWTDLQAVLDVELARLPDKYRIPVVLCDLGGRPQREVARELRVPPATLANRLAAARRVLAKRLTSRGVVLNAGAITAALGWHAATSAVPPALAMSTVKAACAAAAGATVALPPPVVQLSEGVLRMFVLNKLKTVATGIVTCLAVLTGIGLMAGPALKAAPEDQPVKLPTAKTDATPPSDPQKPPPDDLVYLRRISLDLRGTLPSTIEAHYFVADTDPKKRNKIVEWMLPGHANQMVSSTCTSCHAAPFGPPALSQIPYLNRLFKNSPSAVDQPGTIDSYIATLLFEGDGKKDKAWRPAVLEPFVIQQLNTELANSNIAAAQAELKLAEDEARKNPKSGQQLIEQARAHLAAARATADLAEKHAVIERERADLNAIKSWYQKLAEANSTEDGATKRLANLYRFREKLPTDAEFIRRLSLDVRGVPPSTVETKYFEADKDPQKREKLLKLMASSKTPTTAAEKLVQELVADPEIQKRWAELLQQRIYAEQLRQAHEAWAKKPQDRLENLLDDMLAKDKSSEQMLNALCLATLARYPTDTERSVILDGMKAQPNRRAAWLVVLNALSATNEAKAYAVELGKRGK
ncbi:MAG TPA: sigma-70 family RNA polymerase sigma factor [Gemmataceae bacterium]|jgi:RNA polymerase sigma factor (sigma-70 family)|nr:sigma-70 family RNA polymerase sigma factor [Gemmataceae bacterium]